MTKNYVIQSGNWAKDSKNGNFTGYNSKGERVHIYGAQMTSLGFKHGEAVKFPLFVIAMPKTYSKVDDEGKEIEGTEFTRLTATAVFTDQKALAGAHIADVSLDIAVKNAIKSTAKDAGLDEKAVAELLATAL
jgi:hypothetical protein